MCVCVVSLSQPSSRDLLYAKCLRVLSRDLRPVEICYPICDVHAPEMKNCVKMKERGNRIRMTR